LKKVSCFILTGILCFGLSSFALNQHVISHKTITKKDKVIVKSEQIKINKKYKIDILPLPKTDCKKYSPNKLPTKFGKVVVKNI
jgi:DNA-directed RNA polymerase subunit H (RpoH/RPB5)